MSNYLGPLGYYGTSCYVVPGVSGSQGATGVSGASGTCGNSGFSTSSTYSDPYQAGSTRATWMEDYTQSHTKELPLLKDFEIIEIKKEVIPTFKDYFQINSILE